MKLKKIDCDGVGDNDGFFEMASTVSESTETAGSIATSASPCYMFDVVYADPPWKYSFSKSNSRKIENHYPVMTVKEICALNVPAAENSVLYLWATAPKLLEALAVMKAWGFTYKTQAVWDKGKIGMGYWFRGQHELLLVGVKGKFSPPEQSKRTSSVYKFTRGKHSKKPVEIRKLIKEWFPGANRLEMFCREPAEGWAVFGNEAHGTISI